MKRIAPILMLLTAPAWAQDPKKGDAAKVDQTRIDEAIKRGILWLKSGDAPPNGTVAGFSDTSELYLWTFLHAGVPETDPKFQEMFRKMLEAKLERTYKVALQAMVLEELDRVKYQSRILQCAQFLLDNQAKSGRWGYGEPSTFVDAIKPPKTVKTGGGEEKSAREFDPAIPLSLQKKPKVRQKVAVSKKKEGGDVVDVSNTQYAALGLRACHDAGILLPREAVLLAQKGLKEIQHGAPDSGWSYLGGTGEGTAYGSMTAGSVGSLSIYDYILDEKLSWKKDPAVLAGLDWLGRNLTFSDNPGRQVAVPRHIYYWIYALERAGALYGTELIGKRDWYAEGAKFLLEAQGAEGAWFGANDPNPHWDTCFAILFLRRATRPLEDVPSVDRYIKKKPADDK